jgi:erythronate-4-phosphate dehydrogenase
VFAERGGARASACSYHHDEAHRRPETYPVQERGAALKIAIDEKIQLGVEAFGSAGEVLALPSRDLDRTRLRDFDALVVRSVTRVDEALLEGTRVGFVGSVTSGVDHVDVDYLEAADIEFVHAPGCNANSVAEYVVAALLHLHERRRIDLGNATLGIVGVGHVGSRVAAKARALGLPVVMNDPPLARAGSPHDLAPLEDALACDVVTLHVPLTRSGDDATFHLLDHRRLMQMKPGGVLINTARGDVVDADALFAAVETGRLSAPVLDVWPGEPDISRDFLAAAALATPHVAGHSRQGKSRGTEIVYGALCGFFGVPPTWTGPDHPLRAVAIGAGATDPLVAVNEAVRTAYDIESESRALKSPGSRFETVRAQHAHHTEFDRVRVELLPGARPALPVLERLGFSV